MDFASRLKKYRKERGLTQVQLAEKAGVSRDSIINYENGRRKNPPIEVVMKICKALNCEWHDFFPYGRKITVISDTDGVVKEEYEENAETMERDICFAHKNHILSVIEHMDENGMRTAREAVDKIDGWTPVERSTAISLWEEFDKYVKGYRET